MQSLSSGTPLRGFGSPPPARVLVPGPGAEQRAAQMGMNDAAEFGARQLMQMAESQGESMTYEDARRQAEQSIQEVFPDS